MNFDLTEDQIMYRESAREFAEKRLFPVAEELDAKGEMPKELLQEAAGGDDGMGGWQPGIPSDNEISLRVSGRRRR